MKKIKSIKQLQAEKKRIRKEQEALEETIRSSWKELKESISPGSVAKEALGKVLNNKTAANMNGESVLKSTFTYGISLLAKKFADKAGRTFGGLFKKR
jgi:hypothetical protein